MNTVASNQVRGFEKCVWLFDETPMDMVHRAVVGALMVPLCEVVVGRNVALWQFTTFFLVALFVFKMGLGGVRRFFPASAELKSAWRERRMLGKAYDSYQWRKQLGYGVGLLAFMLWSGRGQSPVTYFAIGCIVSGIFGTVFWHRRRASLHAPTPASA